jgi:hypothetical protein
VKVKHLMLFLCCLPMVYAAPKKTKEPSIDNNVALVKWVKERVKNAKAGKPELVRFPMVGCLASATCPTLWAIGFSEHMEGSEQDNRWFLALTDGLTLPEIGMAKGTPEWAPVLLVEGYFTGVMRKPTEAEGFSDEEEKQAEFKVLRFSTASESKAERLLKIVATGEAATEKVALLSDDRPWLVLASSKPLFDAESEELAAALKEKLVAAGFSDAESFDSRKAKNLFCCYLVVVAGRYKTKEEAQATVKKAKEKGFDTYTKQGW